MNQGVDTLEDHSDKRKIQYIWTFMLQLLQFLKTDPLNVFLITVLELTFSVDTVSHFTVIISWWKIQYKWGIYLQVLQNWIFLYFTCTNTFFKQLSVILPIYTYLTGILLLLTLTSYYFAINTSFTNLHTSFIDLHTSFTNLHTSYYEYDLYFLFIEPVPARWYYNRVVLTSASHPECRLYQLRR